MQLYSHSYKDSTLENYKILQFYRKVGWVVFRIAFSDNKVNHWTSGKHWAITQSMWYSLGLVIYTQNQHFLKVLFDIKSHYLTAARSGTTDLTLFKVKYITHLHDS